jgi:hypothetical protein
MRIRVADVFDSEGITKVRIDTWRTAYAGIVPDAHLVEMSYELGAARWRQGLAERGPREFTLVAVDSEGQIIGFASGGQERDGDPVYRGECTRSTCSPASSAAASAATSWRPRRNDCSPAALTRCWFGLWRRIRREVSTGRSGDGLCGRRSSPSVARRWLRWRMSGMISGCWPNANPRPIVSIVEE